MRPTALPTTLKRYSTQMLLGVVVGVGAITSANVSAAVEAHFLDVGQADATLIEGPSGCTVLIDAGRWDRSDVPGLMDALDVGRIDIFIGTHPHADHIGQLDELIADYEVGEVWMSGYEHDTQTFSRTMDAIRQQGMTYRKPRADGDDGSAQTA